MTLGNIILVFSLLFSIQALDYHDKSFLSLSKSTPTFLQHTRLGKLIINLAQIAAKDTQYTPLFEALDLLLSSLHEQINSENSTFAQSSDLHTSAVSTLSEQISDADLVKKTAENLLENDLQPQKISIVAEIERLLGEIYDWNKKITELQETRIQEQLENSQKILDLTEAINALDEAITILRALNNDAGSSFIQRKYDNLNQAKNLVKLSVSRVKHSFYIETLVQALSFLSEGQTFIDQDTLKRVLSLLKELRDSFETEKQNLADYDDQQQILEENQITSIEATIAALEEAKILAQTQLSDVNSKFLF